MKKLYKKSDRVVLLSKSIWCSLKESGVYNDNKEQGYWYFIRYLSKNESLRKFWSKNLDKVICTVGNKKKSTTGDYFLESDLMEYCGDFLSDEDFKL